MAKVIRFAKWREPIIIAKEIEGKEEYLVAAGEGRTLCARQAGMEKVPVVYQTFDTWDEFRAFTTSHNAIAEWATIDLAKVNDQLQHFDPEFDVDALGLKDFSIEPLEKYGAVDDDAVPEAPKDTRAKPGDVWELGDHVLICEDSTNLDAVLLAFGDRRADLVITDPPYNLDFEGKTKDTLKIENDNMGDDQFYQFLKDAYATMHAVMREGAPIYVFHADVYGHLFHKALVDNDFHFAQCCVWVKNRMVMGRKDYHCQHEPVLYGWKKGAAHAWESDRKQTTVWNFARPTKNKEYPTMKPIELVSYPLLNSSKSFQTVFDPFGGSGSTLIACEKHSRKCVTVEMDPKYCDVILTRWENFTGREAVLRE